ncbi:hypothetical protein T4C_2690 [Trichinella pseudospiralis]|uniref:Uncharacterized protein n=1 Tax=Trichinella pseudospiralis TaxID=6337 RepID=A0A0V1I492_TRIPS|nr:hypothetical protein T4C_2690 [Trichinella pseudospiralis]
MLRRTSKIYWMAHVQWLLAYGEHGEQHQHSIVKLNPK